MNTEGLQPNRRFGAPGDRRRTHILSHHQVIYVLKGSITIGLPERDQQLTLRAGDRLDLSAGVAYHAIIGSKGLVFLEAHCYSKPKTKKLATLISHNRVRPES